MIDKNISCKNKCQHDDFFSFIAVVLIFIMMFSDRSNDEIYDKLEEMQTCELDVKIEDEK